MIQASQAEAGNDSELPAAPLPGPLRAGLACGRIELKTFFREKMAVAFVFALPSVLLVLLGSIFGSQATAQGVTVGQLFSAGMIAGGLMATSFQYLAINIATERERGILKRLYGTPMPHTAYFVGKVIQVVVCALAETALLIAVGVVFYHLHLPTSPGRWWTFGWIFVLGTAGCALLGIAMSSLPRSEASAVPVVTLPFTVLQFISGVYVPYSSVPNWMRGIASVFPLKWMSQGLRSVFLPGRAAALEPAGTWEHGRIALVLGGWIIAGLILCTTTFRWQSRR